MNIFKVYLYVSLVGLEIGASVKLTVLWKKFWIKHLYFGQDLSNVSHTIPTSVNTLRMLVKPVLFEQLPHIVDHLEIHNWSYSSYFIEM